MPTLWDETIDAHRREVRHAILHTTGALVAEHGLLSVTMSQIAEQTGIGRATLYKYFPDVEAILIAWHESQIADHLAQLIDEGGVVNFESVRLRAGVSRSLVYADRELSAQIIELRTRQAGAGTAAPPMPARSIVTERSLRNDLALSQADNRQLRTDATKLRQRLGLAVAAELDATVGGANPASLQSLHDRIAELEDAIHEGSERIRTLEADKCDLSECLDASRENYRQLMAQINKGGR